jgi:polyribonucleotide nucleotidyltransferase
MLHSKNTRALIKNREILFETGKIGRQANATVITRCGDTIVMTAVCANPKVDPGIDFFPLRVDYQEKFSAAGKTLGGFIKREGRPTEKEILVSRLIDRPLRPMFEEGYYNEVQILSYVLSYDGINNPEPLAICGASAALTISDIPLIKPIAAVRVGLINSQFIINPTEEEMKTSTLDLMLAGTEDAILMIEGACNFLSEEKVLEAIEEGHREIKILCETQSQWQQEIGKPKERSSLRILPEDLLEEVEKLATPLLLSALKIKNKQEREQALDAVDAAVKESLGVSLQEVPYDPAQIVQAIKKISAHHMRQMILKENIRSDGRNSTQIRQIHIEHGLLPRTHGSALFTRGETQALAVCTLGSESMGQRFEGLNKEGINRFYLQYSFPPFSVGEVGRAGPPGRREIGHGKLAERALQAILPTQESFPYIIRLESNITESNGSSSMATVCGGCLALMDAGVPIKGPIAGIAMGLILEENGYVILSDILGIEDALGDMDFKIAGNHEGITAFQMDIKVEGITHEIMRAALAQAKEGRVHILNEMVTVFPRPKEKMSIYAPRIETLRIKPSKIATIIGPGGKQIRAIVEQTGVQVDIADDGTVNLSSSSAESIEKAKNIIFGLTAEVEIGKVYDGKITSIMPFGVFVEVLPGKEGLCHISEFDTKRIENMADHAKQGDEIRVKVLDINDRGQLKLSRKVLLGDDMKK